MKNMNPKIEKIQKIKKPKKQRKPLDPKTKKILTVVLSLAFTALLTLTIICGYVLNFVNSYVNGDAKINISEYKENQAQTTIIYAYKGEEIVELTRLHGEQNRVWIGIDEIPDNLQKAYIALEDKRFPDHGGVDWLRTVKAVATMGEAGGGSTITQQLIKNLTGENSKTVSRKFYEILNALNLEKNASKDTILEAYLNTVYMSHGCYGVKTTAEKYFGKEVEDLNIAECAAIAAITKHPSKNDPLIHPEENRKRQLTCLNNMLEEGYITQEEYDEAKAYEMVFTNSENYVEDTKKKDKDKDKENTQKEEFNSYYVDYVIEEVIQDFMTELDYTRQQASKAIYNGGLRIYSAVDLDVQAELEDVYENRISMPKYNKNIPDAQSAMTIMDYSGRIVGIAGGVGKKTENRGLNRATSFRQPGSSIKPLSVYSVGVNEGYITYSSTIQNYGFMVNGKLWPHNYGGDPGSPDSFLTVQRAIAVSYNTVPAQLVRKMGVNLCYEYLTERYHLGHLSENDKSYAPLAVGGLTYGTSTLEMAAAFACFGNGGKYYEPYSYYKITNASGTKIILQNDKKEPEQAISSESADIMNKLLQTVVTDAAHMSTGRNYGIEGFQTFAKTGTTTDDKDRWFVGGTPHYVAAVWFGCDKPKQISDYVTGNPAGAIFDTVMTRIHADIDEDREFELHSKNVISARYCVSSGRLATSSCGTTGLGWYSKDNMPGYCKGDEPTTEIVTDENGNIITQPATTTKPDASKPATTKPSAPVTQAPVTQAPVTQAPTPTPTPEPTPEPSDD